MYRSYGGVVLEVEEGQNIARLLGNKKVRMVFSIHFRLHI